MNGTAHGRSRKRPNLKLKALRINAGLSPNDLARVAGVSGNSVRMAEAGFLPGPRVQFAIAEALGKEPLDIWPIERQAVAA